MFQIQKQHFPRRLVAVLTIVTMCAMAVTHAAELHLRRECHSAGALVTLGDLVEIYSNDEAEKSRLSGIELFPAPADGQSRLVGSREIQDVLAQRGVDLRRCRMSGASAVNVQGPRPEAAAPGTPRENWKHVLESRISDYLQGVDSFASWQVAVNVTGDLQRTLAGGGEIVRVSGGREPWVGSQRFNVTVSDGNTQRDLPVIANVQRPFAVVVPIRPLSRGEVVQASDVQLQTVASAANNANSLSRIEHAIGQETTRPLPAGRPLQRSDIRPAVLVAKNSIVTVFARSPGIQVRTSAKALEDGAQDDVIKLQSLEDRDEQFVARVTAFKEVEILAGSPRVEVPATRETQQPRNNTTTTDTNRLGTTQSRSTFGLRVLP